MIKLDTKSRIIIIGAGYVGCTLALLLKRAGLSVVVLEKAPEKVSIPDDRHFGIARETRLLLENLGLWPELQAQVTEIATMQIQSVNENLLSLGNDQDVIGRILPAALLHATLRRAVQEAEIPILFDQHVTELIQHTNRIEITINTGELLVAPLLVAADGMHSQTRTLADIDVQIRDYNQNAQQWRITHTQAHHAQAFEMLLPEGPYVVLPTKDPKSSKLIWCRDKDTEPDDSILMRHFPTQLGEIEILDYIGAYPLNMQQAKTPYQGRVVLVGDAYQRVHPVAAQGLNIGLRDAQALAEILIEAQYLGLDMGSRQLLNRFAASRHTDRFMVRSLTDFLGDKAGKPALQKPLGMLSHLLATAPAKRAIRTAFHGE